MTISNHHAYVYEGPLSAFDALVSDVRKRFLGGTSAGSLALWARMWEKFGIDESRELGSAASLRAVGNAQVFVIGVGNITAEAQQALLKLLEEPHAGAVFVFLVGHGSLLPTLRSRFTDYPALALQEAPLDDAVSFFSSAYKQRSDWIASFLKDEEGVHERARVFVSACEQLLYKKLRTATPKDTPLLYEALESIAQMRPYLSDRAPSLKMILEHLAAVLPKL